MMNQCFGLEMDPFMVFMKPGQDAQLYMQWQARNLDFIPFGSFDPELMPCLQVGRGTGKAHPQTLSCKL